MGLFSKDMSEVFNQELLKLEAAAKDAACHSALLKLLERKGLIQDDDWSFYYEAVERAASSIIALGVVLTNLDAPLEELQEWSAALKYDSIHELVDAVNAVPDNVPLSQVGLRHVALAAEHLKEKIHE